MLSWFFLGYPIFISLLQKNTKLNEYYYFLYPINLLILAEMMDFNKFLRIATDRKMISGTKHHGYFLKNVIPGHSIRCGRPDSAHTCSIKVGSITARKLY